MTTLKEIRNLEQIRYPTPTRLVVDDPPVTPTTLTVTGRQGVIQEQWSTVPGVDGYDIAVMTTQNLAAPDINIARVMGDKNREYNYWTGNVAVTRYFAVRSFKSNYFSAWSAIVSGTSLVFGAVEGAPPSPPSYPPSGDEPPPSGGGLPGRPRTA